MVDLKVEAKDSDVLEKLVFVIFFIEIVLLLGNLPRRKMQTFLNDDHSTRDSFAVVIAGRTCVNVQLAQIHIIRSSQFFLASSLHEK